MDKLDEFKSLKTPVELMEFMNENIEYGCLDKEGNKYNDDMVAIKKNLQLLSIEDTLNNGIGTCLEQVELERLFFINNRYPVKSFVMKVYKDEKLRDEESVRMHNVLVFYKDSAPYIFEHSWEDYRAITRYETLSDVFSHLVDRYLAWEDVLDKGYNYYKIMEYNSPPIGITFEEMKAYANNYSPVVTGVFTKNKVI